MQHTDRAFCQKRRKDAKGALRVASDQAIQGRIDEKVKSLQGQKTAATAQNKGDSTTTVARRASARTEILRCTAEPESCRDKQ